MWDNEHVPTKWTRMLRKPANHCGSGSPGLHSVAIDGWNVWLTIFMQYMAMISSSIFPRISCIYIQHVGVQVCLPDVYNRTTDHVLTCLAGLSHQKDPKGAYEDSLHLRSKSLSLSLSMYDYIYIWIWKDR